MAGRASPELVRRAKDLRFNATPEERLLWSQLKNRKFAETRWLRQYPVAGYVLDFYCARAKLVVELDGSQHELPDSVDYDVARTQYLGARGLRVLRFRNAEVRQDVGSVLERIEAELR